PKPTPTRCSRPALPARRSSPAYSMRSFARSGDAHEREHAGARRAAPRRAELVFFRGLQEAWRHHLKKLWGDRQAALPADRDPDALIHVPEQALYYASLGCVILGAGDIAADATYAGTERLRWWLTHGQHELKANEGARGLIGSEEELRQFLDQYGERNRHFGALSFPARTPPANS